MFFNVACSVRDERDGIFWNVDIVYRELENLCYTVESIARMFERNVAVWNGNIVNRRVPFCRVSIERFASVFQCNVQCL